MSRSEAYEKAARSEWQAGIFFLLISRMHHSLTVKKEALRPSETSEDFCRTKRREILERVLLDYKFLILLLKFIQASGLLRLRIRSLLPRLKLEEKGNWCAYPEVITYIGYEAKCIVHYYVHFNTSTQQCRYFKSQMFGGAKETNIASSNQTLSV
jgi:hypothetical protein